jgi:prolyl-tRNA synthetase
MRGIPLRLEVGPRDIEAGQAILVRRDNGEKETVAFTDLEKRIPELLQTIQKDMLEKARAHRDANTHTAKNWDEFKDIIENRQGFIKAMWCGETACEEEIKAETGASTRCMPFAQEEITNVCVHCGKPAKKMVYFGRAY